MTKIALYIALFLVGNIAGVFLQQRVISRPTQFTCPDCNCPQQPAVALQPFDVDKIKNVKGFTYAPQYTGNVTVGGTDTTRIREIIERSITRALAKKSKR